MIYHYCSATAFKGIISTKEVWLTDITKLNDITEYESGFDLIVHVLQEKGLAEKPEFLSIQTEKLNEKFQILIGCFSSEGDVGSQWRLYADDSKGLSIGFDENEIDQFNLFNRVTANCYQPIISHVKLCKVNYIKDEFVGKVRSFIYRMEQSESPIKDQLTALALRRFAALYKDQYFKDEREIRAVVEIEPGRDEGYAIDVRVNAYKEEARFHRLLTSYQNLSAIKEVIIGPNCSYSIEDVEGMLTEHGIEKVKIRYSSGRGRYRNVSI
jgi:hypothetical protein